MKKETYLNAENIDVVMEEMFRCAMKFGRERPQPIRPGAAGLLVLDMQEYFLSPSSPAFLPAAEAVIERVKALIRLCRDQNIPVFFTRHENTRLNSGMMGTWWGRLLEKGDPLSRISPHFNTKGCPVITKTQYDAFFRTDLEKKLREAGAETLIVAGVMTHLCCETTVRSAFVRGFQTVFPMDTTAAPNRHLHQSAFNTLAHGFSGPCLLKHAAVLMGDK